VRSNGGLSKKGLAVAKSLLYLGRTVRRIRRKPPDQRKTRRSFDRKGVQTSNDDEDTPGRMGTDMIPRSKGFQQSISGRSEDMEEGSTRGRSLQGEAKQAETR